MNILSLESSTRQLSVALWLDGDLFERTESIPNGGSERLLPWVSEMFAETGTDFGNLDGIAFGTGPGGFTGLRLACGVAQGLAFGLDLPVLGVSSLEALALQAHHEGLARAEYLFACLDARMGEVYCAAYLIHDDQSETMLAPMVGTPQSAAMPRAPDGRKWVGCGDGFVSYPSLLAGQLAEIRADCWPTAAAVARLAAPRLCRGEGVAAGAVAPLYVRDKVALTTAERMARGGLN